LRDLALGLGNACNTGALVDEQELGVGPALVFIADAVRHRHLDISEKNFVQVMQAVDGNDRLHLDAGRLHVDQKERDAFLLFGGLIRSHETEYPIGFMGIGRPDFLAVDDVMVALTHGLGFQRGEIRSGPRFRITLAPPDIAGKNARQMLLFLRFVTEGVDHRSHHGQTEWRKSRCVSGGHLLVENMLLHRRPSSAAILPGPIDRYPAFLVEIFLPAPERAALTSRAHCVSLRELPGQFFRNESADFRAEGFVLFRKLYIHLLTFRGNDPGICTFHYNEFIRAGKRPKCPPLSKIQNRLGDDVVLNLIRSTIDARGAAIAVIRPHVPRMGGPISRALTPPGRAPCPNGSI